MAEIVNINVTKLLPHPDNPRKEIGDIQELTESIKANGILQNLTVVPKRGEISRKPSGGYTVIIGHRRLAAAKAAGLKTVPCVVTEMTLQEQVGAMLLENMQRSDLTVYEQAQGFQMMMDLGETVDTVAQKTGFSPSTVRRRVKLLDLDAGKFKASESRGATLQDYMELDKLKGPELRNRVLDAIGTPNFPNKLRQAIEEEKRAELVPKLVAALEPFATRLPDDAPVDRGKMDWQESYCWWGKKEVRPPEDAESAKYFFRVGKFQVDLYKEKTETAAKEAAKEAEERRRQRREQIHKARYAEAKEARKRHYELRKAFIKDFPRTKSSLAAILPTVCIATVRTYGADIDKHLLNDLLEELLGEPIRDEDGDLEEALLAKAVAKAPEYTLLAAAYAARESEGEGYFWLRWNNAAQCQTLVHARNEDLDALYSFLTSLGYAMSDEEKAMQDGSHELFREVREDE